MRAVLLLLVIWLGWYIAGEYFAYQPVPTLCSAAVWLAVVLAALRQMRRLKPRQKSFVTRVTRAKEPREPADPTKMPSTSQDAPMGRIHAIRPPGGWQQ